jgi:hypothetical protein
MVKPEVQKYFQDNVVQYQKTAETLAAAVLRWSWLRAVYFIVVAGLVLYFANQRMGLGVVGSLALGAIGFVGLIVRHNHLKKQRNLYQQLHLINQEELDRQEHHFTDLPDGAEFKHPFHPYAKDLDIFGKHSLFQYLNRTSTPGGQARLAHYLKQAAPAEVVLQRQAAAQELAGAPEWRQQFAAQGRMFPKKPDSLGAFYEWLNAPNKVLNAKWPWAALATLPAVSVVIIVMASFGMLTWSWLWLPVILNGIILSRVIPLSRAAHKATEPALGTLKTLASSSKLIEQKEWSSSLLKSLKEELSSEDKKLASQQIGLLSSILTGLESQNNAFYFMLNFLFLQDLYWLLRAERWRALQQTSIERWFGAMFEWEALNSLAGLAFAEPHWSWPQLATGEAHFDAEELGHPLLTEGRVTNNFKLIGNGQAVLITGSNMAGKSTFLRTVGINIVLALAGAPVCARRLSLSPMQVFTSMRTEDNLEESVSSFYAELQRLQQLLAIIKADEKVDSDLPIPDSVQTDLPVLYFLDEILKGTNSEDRHRGAAALIRQLQNLGATGLVSTHDLVLGQAAEQTGLQNYSFNSVVEGDQIHFNYKLEPGICTSFNATALMKKMGIEV